MTGLICSLLEDFLHNVHTYLLTYLLTCCLRSRENSVRFATERCSSQGRRVDIGRRAAKLAAACCYYDRVIGA